MNNKIKFLKLTTLLTMGTLFFMGGCPTPPPSGDTTPPKITIVGDNPLEIRQGETFSDPGVTAEDGVDSLVTVIPSGSVDMEKEGEYTITYTATDEAGNVATEVRTVKVVNTDIIWHVSDVSSFRQALESASANGEHDTIILTEGVYKTTSDGLGTFVFNDNEAFDLTIKSAEGLTYNDVVLDGVDTNRVFYFNNTTGGKVTFDSVTIQHGIASSGGGFYSHQATTLKKCKIVKNKATYHSDGGAGFYSKGFALILDSIISDNVLTGTYPRGAGFYTRASVKIHNSTISNNSGANEGGGFYVRGTSELNNTILQQNSAKGGSGGAFYSTGDTYINNVTIKNNNANYGGGFYVRASTSVIDSKISNNNASIGGGFYAKNGSLFINRSLFVNNNANYGGGFDFTSHISSRKATILNSNFMNNSASNKGSIFTAYSFSYIFNNTFVDNKGSIDSKGLFVNNIFYKNSSDLTLKGESKVYNNYIDHTKINEGGNVVIKKENLQPSSVGNINLADDYKTLLSNSPVIDKGLNPSSITFKNLIDNNTTYTQIVELLKTDMLGNQRVANDTIDMGAVEYGSIK